MQRGPFSFEFAPVTKRRALIIYKFRYIKETRNLLRGRIDYDRVRDYESVIDTVESRWRIRSALVIDTSPLTIIVIVYNNTARS